jgi:hypothetical protein
MRCYTLALIAIIIPDLTASEQGLNANLCTGGPKVGTDELLSAKPTQELVSYLEGLRSGKYGFSLRLNGWEAASRLGFGKRFSANYGQMLEEARLRIKQKGKVHIDELIEYLGEIVGQETNVDRLTPLRGPQFSAIVYSRTLQIGECSFPSVVQDIPTEAGMLAELQRGYPALNLNDAARRGGLLRPRNQITLVRVPTTRTAR